MPGRTSVDAASSTPLISNSPTGSAHARTDAVPGGVTRALHIVVLWSFACARPLLVVLTDAPAFFTARDMAAIDIWTVCIGVVFVAPAVLAGVSWLVFLANRPIGSVLHIALVGALLTLIALPPLARATEPAPGAALPIALAIGVFGVALYLRWKRAVPLLSIYAVAPFIFATVFIFDPGVAAVRSAPEPGPVDFHVNTTAPVLLIVFDELPLYSLLDDEWQINKKLFPNFAKLASHGTWFRNASSVHVDTTDNLVSILTGRFPTDRPTTPNAADHPNTLLSWLRQTHNVNAHETVTQFAPSATDEAEPPGPEDAYLERTKRLTLDLTVIYAHIVLPERYNRWLPSLEGTWQNFGHAGPDADLKTSVPDDHLEKKETARDYRKWKFARFVDGFWKPPRPTLNFMHSILPHSPFVHLPDGTLYPADRAFIGIWGEVEWPTTLAFQRHLLQLGWADSLLGLAIRKLERLGIYDKSLIAVLSDHGVTFRPGRSARYLADDTLEEILRVICIIKRPGQRNGEVDDRNFEHPDLLPTIADALGEPIPWPVDGQSGFDEANPERPTKSIRGRGQKLWTVDGRFPSEITGLKRRIELFGPSPGWSDIYALGPRPDLVGQPVTALEVKSDGAAVATALVNHYEWFQSVEKPGRQRPHLVKGQITVPEDGRLPKHVAIAVNGTIQAVTYGYHQSENTIDFEAVIPLYALHVGANELMLFDLRNNRRAHPIEVVSAPQ